MSATGTTYIMLDRPPGGPAPDELGMVVVNIVSGDVDELQPDLPYKSFQGPCRKHSYKIYNEKNRWMSVEGEHVKYFGSESDCAKGKKPKGDIELHSLVEVGKAEKGGEQHKYARMYVKLVCMIYQPHQCPFANACYVYDPFQFRAWYFGFPDPSLRDAAVEAINYNLERIRANKGETFSSKALQMVQVPQVSSILGQKMGIVKFNLRTRYRPSVKPTDERPEARAYLALKLKDENLFRQCASMPGFDPNLIVAKGVTLCELLCTSEYFVGWLSWLLSKFKVDVHQRDEVVGDTAIIFASRMANAGAVRILLDFGANRQDSNKLGETCMTEALNPMVKTILQTYMPMSMHTPGEGAEVQAAEAPKVPEQRDLNEYLTTARRMSNDAMTQALQPMADRGKPASHFEPPIQEESED